MSEWKPEKRKVLCHHIWIGLGDVLERLTRDKHIIEKLYQHQCPKCGKIKTTIRKLIAK